MMYDREFWRAADDELVRARAAFPGQEYGLALADWCAILTEEVGEVARCCNEWMLGRYTANVTTDHLIGELRQVAAMAARMASALSTTPELQP